MPKTGTAGSKTQEVALAPAKLFETNIVMSVPPDQLTDDELITVWSMLDLLEKSLVKERKSELRDEMFSRAEKYGDVNEKGSFLWKLRDGKITRQKTVKKGYAEPALVRANLGTDPVVKKTLRTQWTLKAEDKEALVAILATSDHLESSRLIDSLNSAPVSVDDGMFQSLVKSQYISSEIAAAVMTKDTVTWTLKVTQPSTVEPLKSQIERAKRRRAELADG